MLFFCILFFIIISENAFKVSPVKYYEYINRMSGKRRCIVAALLVFTQSECSLQLDEIVIVRMHTEEYTEHAITVALFARSVDMICPK